MKSIFCIPPKWMKCIFLLEATFPTIYRQHISLFFFLFISSCQDSNLEPQPPTIPIPSHFLEYQLLYLLLFYSTWKFFQQWWYNINTMHWHALQPIASTVILSQYYLLLKQTPRRLRMHDIKGINIGPSTKPSIQPSYLISLKYSF